MENNSHWHLLGRDHLPEFNCDLVIQDDKGNYYVGQFITAQISEEECLFGFKMKSKPDIERPVEVFSGKRTIQYFYINDIL